MKTLLQRVAGTYLNTHTHTHTRIHTYAKRNCL